ncbi:MAG: M20/M25/M40 family metallo-hydrolase [Bacteroidales bacterium]|nr:M20/M25/M40 family metallo-hydrolase [Bacteroidales bacterium]
MAEWLAGRLPGMFPAANRPVLRTEEVGDGTLNLLLTWGAPRIVFCSHMDTVPPYIPPTFPEGLALPSTDSFAPLGMTEGLCPSEEGESDCHSEEAEGRRKNLKDVIKGRGSCDAKGQVFAMVTACQQLAEQGCTDFGLLLLAGEETGSWGAKAFAKTDFRGPYLVVGEPTDNCMVSASKGTKSFDLRFIGEAFHSGYPEHGVSAVDLFVEFVNTLKAKDFGMDPVLGATTWNIGLVHSDNPQNILSPELTCRLYFRTTFVSDEAVCKWMASLGPEAGTDSGAYARIGSRSDAEESVPASGRIRVTARGGDTPARYWTAEGLPSKSVAFGSDAPHLKNFTHKAICGPGSITVAHRDDEHVLVRDLEQAVEQYLMLYRKAQRTE